jgi:hypothetical protein
VAGAAHVDARTARREVTRNRAANCDNRCKLIHSDMTPIRGRWPAGAGEGPSGPAYSLQMNITRHNHHYRTSVAASLKPCRAVKLPGKWRGFFGAIWHGARAYDRHRTNKSNLHNIIAIIRRRNRGGEFPSGRGHRRHGLGRACTCVRG